MRQHLNKLVTLLCIALTGASFYNVLGDHTAVEALARGAAPACAAGCTMTRLDRSPISQNFEFTAKDGKTAAVSCARAGYLVGDYACKPR